MFYPFFDPTSIPMIFMDPRSNTPHWTHFFPLRSYLSAAASCTRPSQRTRDMKHPTAGGLFFHQKIWNCHHGKLELNKQQLECWIVEPEKQLGDFERKKSLASNLLVNAKDILRSHVPGLLGMFETGPQQAEALQYASFQGFMLKLQAWAE